MQHHRLGRRMRQVHIVRGRARGGARRQGAEGRGGEGDRPVQRHVAHDDHIDRPVGDGRLQRRLERLGRGGGHLLGSREGEARVAGMHQVIEVPRQHARRGGVELVLQGRHIGADALEGFGPVAGGRQIGGQHLHLRGQVDRSGRALQDEAVVGGLELRAIDLVGQDLVDLLGGEVLQAAVDEGA